jgi:hypothetical protein
VTTRPIKIPALRTAGSVSAALASAGFPGTTALALGALTPTPPFLSATPVSLPKLSLPHVPSATRSSLKFEIAPAGTYARMEQAIAMSQQLITTISTGAKRVPAIASSWYSDAKAQIAELPANARDEGTPAPSESILSFARDALLVGALKGIPEPAITHDDEGGVELFFKKGESALLLVLRADAVAQVFGDFKNEQWRARYSLAGGAWKRHFAEYISGLANERA